MSSWNHTYFQLQFSHTYSCCVNEVATKHANADALMHCRHACMTLCVSCTVSDRPICGRATTARALRLRLPVIYVSGRKAIDVLQCFTALLGAYNAEAADAPQDAILLTHNVAYAYMFISSAMLSLTPAVGALLGAMRRTKLVNRRAV